MAKRAGHAGDKFHSGRIGKVVLVEDERAIPIEKKSFGHRGWAGEVREKPNGDSAQDRAFSAGTGRLAGPDGADQLLGRNGGRADLADDDARGGIGKMSGGFKRGTGGERQHEGGQGSVARA